MPNGCVSGHGVSMDTTFDENSMKNFGYDLVKLDDDTVTEGWVGSPIDMTTVRAPSTAGGAPTGDAGAKFVFGKTGTNYPTDKDPKGQGTPLPMILYPGRVVKRVNGKFETVQPNMGHLGVLDGELSLFCCGRVRV